MAGDWIKMRSDLFTHPKVVQISSALKADRLRTVGGLMSVWCLFDVHSVDGKLNGYSFSAIDDLIGWAGFSEKMSAVGWLDVGDNSLALPRFDTHNGQSAKRRAQDSERKRVVRNESASEADKTRTREEKRREEKSKEQRSKTTTVADAPEYSDEFESAWKAYPSRPGASKKESFKAWSARLKSGVDPDDMISGAIRYSEYVTAMNTEPQFIKQPATFFGPGDHYNADWKPSVTRYPITRPESRHSGFDKIDYSEGITDGRIN